MDTYGSRVHVWTPMVAGVHVWTPMVVGVHVWTLMVLGGKCMDTHGRGKTCMVTYGSGWGGARIRNVLATVANLVLETIATYTFE